VIFLLVALAVFPTIQYYFVMVISLVTMGVGGSIVDVFLYSYVDSPSSLVNDILTLSSVFL